MNPTPRRDYPLSLGGVQADVSYLESDRDYVLNNLEWCVEQLDQYFLSGCDDGKRGFRAIKPASPAHAAVLEDLARRIDDE